MTNAEAIRILRESRIAYIAPNGKQLSTEALDMAIRALKNEQTDGDLISRQAVIDGLASIAKVKAKSDAQKALMGRSMYFVEKLPSAEKTTLSEEKTTITDGDLITEIDALPRIKVGNSNSPTVKYCIDEVLLYDLLERYKAEKTATWIKQKSGDELFPEEIVCSKCYHSNSHLDFDEHNNPIGKVFLKSKYCPNCGAKMKGVE